MKALNHGMSYTPYGCTAVSKKSSLAFNGQRWDQLLDGFTLGNGIRSYKPKLMRFISPDPSSPFGMGGFNAYAYCSGDPVNFTDPTGLTKSAQSLKNIAKNTMIENSKSWNYLGEILSNTQDGNSRSPNSANRQYSNMVRNLFNQNDQGKIARKSAKIAMDEIFLDNKRSLAIITGEVKEVLKVSIPKEWNNEKVETLYRHLERETISDRFEILSAAEAYNDLFKYHNQENNAVLLRRPSFLHGKNFEEAEAIRKNREISMSLITI
jgi:RHS repeat-associated protein